MNSYNRNMVEVTCQFCANTFEAPRSMKGGVANCPSCKRATKVGGGVDTESLFWVVCVAVVIGIVILTGLAALSGGWYGGITVFMISLLVGGAIIASL